MSGLAEAGRSLKTPVLAALKAWTRPLQTSQAQAWSPPSAPEPEQVQVLHIVANMEAPTHNFLAQRASSLAEAVDGHSSSPDAQIHVADLPRLANHDSLCCFWPSPPAISAWISCSVSQAFWPVSTYNVLRRNCAMLSLGISCFRQGPLDRHVWLAQWLAL